MTAPDHEQAERDATWLRNLILRADVDASSTMTTTLENADFCALVAAAQKAYGISDEELTSPFAATHSDSEERG